MKPLPTIPTISHRRQRGNSLFTVLMLLVLCLTSVFGAFRVSSLNEAMLGNNSDYNRAWAAAEALVRDAEMDIRGRRPPYNTTNPDGTRGLPCRPVPANDAASLIVEAGFIGCRNQAAANTPWFPRNSEDFDTISDITLANGVANGTNSYCMQGICVPPDTTSLAHIENEDPISGTNLVNLASMTNLPTTDPRATYATYGQYTRNALAAPGVSGNPILCVPPDPACQTVRAWYWIEAFRYSQAVSGGAAPPGSNIIPDTSAPYVYRITAVARGLKPGTKVVVKSIFVPYPAGQNQ